MITLIHGDNLSASLSEIEKIKSDYKLRQANIVEIDGKKLDRLGWEDASGSSGLFANEKLIIVNNYFGNKHTEEIDFENTVGDIIFSEIKRLSTIPKIPSLVIKKFDVDPVVFKFLDSISPNNRKEMLSLFKKYLDVEIPEIILTMIVRQFRLLLLSKSNAASGPTEWQNLAPWQKARLNGQAGKFTVDQLKDIYSQLSKIDVENKNGAAVLPVSDRLELLLLSI